MKISSMYRPEIDGLRAVAVLAVILFHADVPGFGGGYVGVDVFFVISGYLITSLIVAEREAGTFSLVRFYERRARRILPALLAVLCVVMVGTWFILLPIDAVNVYGSILAALGMVSNVLFWRESGYFDTAAELKPLLHTWSLAVEEQFYLLYPLGVLGLLRMGRRWFALVLGVVAVASLAARGGWRGLIRTRRSSCCRCGLGSCWWDVCWHGFCRIIGGNGSRPSGTGSAGRSALWWGWRSSLFQLLCIPKACRLRCI
jgi:peptidoglycan/LPS O-acetylase OafA/YrhL